MRNIIKLGLGAAVVAGAVYGIRRLLDKRDFDIDLDAMGLDEDIDIGEPMIVAEEIVIVAEPAADGDFVIVPEEGFSSGR